jgi:hypothetical protein
MNGELILTIFIGISSYPYESLDLRDLIIFSTSLVVVRSNIIFGNGCGNLPQVHKNSK